MRTISTQSISIDAPSRAVMALVADPLQLPRWAPAFARSVHADGDAWIVSTGGQKQRVRIRVSHEHGTVDFLAADTPDGVDVGAFARVISNGRGSEFMFSRFFGPDERADDVARAKAVVAQELQAVRAIVEAGQ